MRPLRALAITALAAASLALVPAPSAITATCYGTGCDGQYPAETGCYESAYPIRRDSNDRVQIELWFSTVCQTKWSQVYYTMAGQIYWSPDWSASTSPARPSPTCRST